MANWRGTARSNHFRVKDEFAFRAWAGTLGLDVVDRIGEEDVSNARRQQFPDLLDDLRGIGASHGRAVDQGICAVAARPRAAPLGLQPDHSRVLPVVAQNGPVVPARRRQPA